MREIILFFWGKDERECEKRREIVIKILVSSHAPCPVYVRLGIKENRNSKKKKKRKIKEKKLVSLDKVKNKIKILNVILSEISKWIENFFFYF